jgi:hypothetical protein
LVEIVHPQFLPVFSGSIIISQIYTRVAVWMINPNKI